jgi:hypothetical protein
MNHGSLICTGSSQPSHLVPSTSLFRGQKARVVFVELSLQKPHILVRVRRANFRVGELPLPIFTHNLILGVLCSDFPFLLFLAIAFGRTYK